jgi:quercetin dioxygenase-like cupin family protein
MEYVRGRQGGHPSRIGEGTFTGRAMLDPLLDDGAVARVRVNSVVFEPRARTYWHSHADGQVLIVGSGRGAVETRDGHRHVLHPGDIVWAPPGEVHWHGAAPDSFLVHTAVSLGATTWLEEVPADRYEEAFSQE